MTRHTDWTTPAAHTYTHDYAIDLTATPTYQYTHETFDFTDAPVSVETSIDAPLNGGAGFWLAAARIWRYGGVGAEHYALWTVESVPWWVVDFGPLVGATIQDFVTHLATLLPRPSWMPPSATLEWEDGLYPGDSFGNYIGYPTNGTLAHLQVNATILTDTWTSTLTYGASSNPLEDVRTDGVGPIATVELRRYGDFQAAYPAGPADTFTPRVERTTGVRWEDALTDGITETGVISVDPNTLPTLGGTIAGTPLPYMTLGIVPTMVPTLDPASMTPSTEQVFHAGLHIGFERLTWQPPRYRWVWDGDLPPLRQYPRDDAAGGAPRQGTANQSISVQSSARQGWTNTYR